MLEIRAIAEGGVFGYQMPMKLLDKLLDRHEWHVVERPWGRVTLVDGTESTETYVWGRKINGVWSYRDLTNDEYNLHIAEISI
ncbi:hypothetical protein [Mesorhizobium sp. B2-4-7]|uniref:hypothetical protein n=1 Tax=Mesorhizobium sp. B2-4-7 TaxID=2589942 RepID=UPI00112EC893|nr:hypothetical protein [Mesorhizobium sp. B2-4-7]TPL30167.1 hypothetical protein FJ946_02560 [Mesorhizobium sp. B2-4-7]